MSERDEPQSHPTEITPVTFTGKSIEAQVGSETPPGERVGGRYVLVSMLGKGGMGTVYKARDVDLDEIVALKMLRGDLASDVDIVERFKREVKLARRVTHRNVARMYDIGEHAGGRFLTMEFIDGMSLSRLLHDRGALPLSEVVRIATEICDGLAAAHAEGIVHRDLKPDNVLTEDTGRIVITDFGIARALRGGQESQLTGHGMVGTPMYMAPEQLERGAAIDHRADVYALGVILYQLLAGRAPWDGDTAFEVLKARLDLPQPDLRARRPGLAAEVDELVRACMSEDPGQRPESVAAMLTALGALGAGADTDAPPLTIALPTGAGEGETTRVFSALPSTGIGQQTTQPGMKTLAVLPLRNRGPESDAYLADGLTEELIDLLSMTDGLRVRPRADVVGREVSRPRTVGRELGVQAIVEGAIRRQGPEVQVTARLISVEDGFQLWARRFSTAGDVLEISDEVAGAIAAALTVDLAEPVTLAPRDPVATDLFLKARYAMHRGWYDDVEPAAALFEQALARAPEDPRILAGAATAQARMIFLDSPQGSAHEARARELIARALEAAPERGEAYFAQAMVCMNRADPAGTIAACRQAIARAPQLADAHDLLGHVLLEVAPPREALHHLEVALELDPSLPNIRWDFVKANALLGQWDVVDDLFARPVLDDGARALRQVLRARFALWRAAADSSAVAPDPEPILRPEQAIGALTRILRTVGETRSLAPADRGEIEATLARVGDRNRRYSALVLQHLVEIQAFLGDTHAALDALERCEAFGLFDRSWLAMCPLLSALRDDARCRAVRDRVEDRLEPGPEA